MTLYSFPHRLILSVVGAFKHCPYLSDIMSAQTRNCIHWKQFNVCGCLLPKYLVDKIPICQGVNGAHNSRVAWLYDVIPYDVVYKVLRFFLVCNEL